MNLEELYKKFPKESDLILLIEDVFWDKCPTCPYCLSKNYSQRKKNSKDYKIPRYHCNNCNTDYTVLVNSIFQNTKLQLHKWILAIIEILDSDTIPSVRRLAEKLNISKDTALRIRTSILNNITETNLAEIKRRIIS